MSGNSFRQEVTLKNMFNILFVPHRVMNSTAFYSWLTHILPFLIFPYFSERESQCRLIHFHRCCPHLMSYLLLGLQKAKHSARSFILYLGLRKILSKQESLTRVRWRSLLTPTSSLQRCFPHFSCNLIKNKQGAVKEDVK